MWISRRIHVAVKGYCASCSTLVTLIYATMLMLLAEDRSVSQTVFLYFKKRRHFETSNTFLGPIFSPSIGQQRQLCPQRSAHFLLLVHRTVHNIGGGIFCNNVNLELFVWPNSCQSKFYFQCCLAVLDPAELQAYSSCLAIRQNCSQRTRRLQPGPTPVDPPSPCAPPTDVGGQSSRP